MSGEIFSELRSYLQHEWVRLAKDDVDGDTRPKAWERSHGGHKPDFLANATSGRNVLLHVYFAPTPLHAI